MTSNSAGGTQPDATEQCVTIPTRTLTELSTSYSLSTTFTETVTVIPGPTFVSTITTCLQPFPICVNPTTLTTTITEDDITETAQRPLTFAIPETLTSTITLFTISCSPINTAGPSSTATSTSSQANTNTSGTTTTGSESQLPSPSPGDPYPTGGVGQTQNNDHNPSTSSKTVRSVIGGALGAIVALTLLLSLLWFLPRRRRRMKEVSEKQSYERRRTRFSLDMDEHPPIHPRPILTPSTTTTTTQAGGTFSSRPTLRRAFTPPRSADPIIPSFSKRQSQVHFYSQNQNQNQHNHNTLAGGSGSGGIVDDPSDSSRPLPSPPNFHALALSNDRSGSPISFRESRLLTVANATPRDERASWLDEDRDEELDDRYLNLNEGDAYDLGDPDSYEEEGMTIGHGSSESQMPLYIPPTLSSTEGSTMLDSHKNPFADFDETPTPSAAGHGDDEEDGHKFKPANEVQEHVPPAPPLQLDST